MMLGILFAAALAAPRFALAQTAETPAPKPAQCGTAGSNDPYCTKKFAEYAGIADAGTPPTSLPKIIGNVIRLLLLLTGIIFFLFFFWAGLKWMTARGNAEIVEESQRIMENLALGLGVIIISYAFTVYVMGRFFQ